MGACGQPGYVFWDFCLKQGIKFISFCLNQGIDLSIFVLKILTWFWVKCLKQGIKNRNSVSNRVGKSAIFVLNRIRVWGAAPHHPIQGYIEYPPPPRGLVHTTPEKFENVYLFLGLGLLCTLVRHENGALFLGLDLLCALIRHENGAFRKRSSNRRNLRTLVFRLHVDGNRFEKKKDVRANRFCASLLRHIMDVRARAK